MIGIGIVGYGYWGPNLVRNFAEAPGGRVVAVSDLRPERLAAVAARYPSVKTTTDYKRFLADPTIDAVVVSTPVSTHFSIGMQVLRAGKHLLVEKPLTASVEDGLRLLEEAETRRRLVMVDHTFLYTGAVRKIREIVDNGTIGPAYYFDSVRINLGLLQPDVNVLWDLAVHDLSIMDYVLNARPSAVTASGSVHLGRTEDVAYMTCFFEDNLIAHIHVSWLAPVKLRRTLIGGARQMIVYDDLEPSEKIKVYDKGVKLVTVGSNGSSQSAVEYRTGDMWSPKLSTAEGLQVEARHFLDCIEHNRQPLSDGAAGLRVVRILEAASLSMQLRGYPVELDWDRDQSINGSASDILKRVS